MNKKEKKKEKKVPFGELVGDLEEDWEEYSDYEEEDVDLNMNMQ